MGEKRFYWIKLKTDFFNQETIDFLLSQKNGCEYIVLYQMLCLQTANSNGQLSTKIGEMIIPYNVDKIVRDTKYFDFDTVTVALELFKKLGLIYQDDNNVLSIAGYDSMIGSESKSAAKMRRFRENNNQKLIERSQCDPNVTANVTANVTDKTSQCDIEIDIEKEIEKEKDIDIEIEKKNVTRSKSTSVDKPKKEKPIKHKHGEYNNVMLSDAEFEKLKAEFPNDYQSRIERLSGYMQSTGKSYKDHLATIRNWARRDNNNGYSQPSYSQRNYSQPKKEETEEEIQKRQHDQYLRLCEEFGWDPDADVEEVEEKSPEERLRELYEEQERVREGRKREWT